MGQMVARVLSGEPPKNVPIVHDSDLQVHVDWRALQHWHIPESALPPGTVVEYRSLSFWQRDRKYILIALILIWRSGLVDRRLAVAASAQTEGRSGPARERRALPRDGRYGTPSLVWMCDERGRITYLNDRRIAFTGPDPNAGYGEIWITYVHPDDVERMLDTLYEALKSETAILARVPSASKRWSLSLDVRCRLPATERRWIVWRIYRLGD